MYPSCTPAGTVELRAPRARSSTGLSIQVLDGCDLRDKDTTLWRELQGSNQELSSPCFSPEFTRAAAVASRDVSVGILKQGREVVGFFPFQRRRRRRAGPVGGIVSDYQGLICRPDFTCDPEQLVRAGGLVAWEFDRLLASQTFFRPYHRLCEPSARINLTGGYRAYAAARRKAGTHLIQRCEYMMRRLEREVGPLRFQACSCSPRELNRVLAWKSAQYRRTGWKDLFATGWGRTLVERIHSVRNAEFGGMLSLLHAGEHLIAGHMGMRSRTTWHYWFPAYNPRFAKYSAGLILLLKMAQCAEEFGLQMIDIGTGISLYKRRLMNDSIPVAEGSVETRSCWSLIRLTRRKLSLFLKRTPPSPGP